LGIAKAACKDSKWGLQMNFFRESENFWMKFELPLWKRFSGTGSTDWTDALQHMESTWNEVYNG
jgi:hypothetical protein